MLKLTRLCVFLSLVGVCANAYGALQWNFDGSDPLNGYTVQDIVSGGGLQVGDKLIEIGDVTTTQTVGTTAPDATTIAVRGVRVAGNGPDDYTYGLRFNGGWSAGAGEIAHTTISYSVEVTDSQWLLSSSQATITSYGVSTSANEGMASVSQIFYAKDEFPPISNPPVGNTLAYYQNESNYDLQNDDSFAGLPKAWVVMGVVANGGTAATGATQLTEFYQMFGQSEVPEPMTMALLGLGGAGLLLRRRRKA